jgi:acetyl esterase/lipase
VDRCRLSRLVPRRGSAYADGLIGAGVPREVEVVPGVFHGFDMLAPKLPVSQRFFDSQCEIMRPVLAGWYSAG